MEQIYWVSRHNLSPAQTQCLQELYGNDVVVIHDPVEFTTPSGLAEYIWKKVESERTVVGPSFQKGEKSYLLPLIWAVAGSVHIIQAVLQGCLLGVFTNDPVKRADGQFGLKSAHIVTKVNSDDWYAGSALVEVWSNPDPGSDQGDALTPVAR